VRAIVIGLLAVVAGTAQAQPRKTVAVLEYRAGAKGASGVGEKLAALLSANAALDVVSPTDARRKVGPRIDAEVARCGAEAMCIGNIGEKLGAQEVLLIGVSQLGDVVLAMQRIDSRKGEASARLAEALPPDVEPSEEQMLGWLRQLFPPEVFKRYGFIKVVADESGARVELNGEPQGKTPLANALQVRAPGSYKVRLTKSGFVPFLAGIDVSPDATVEVNATLVREEGKQPWYKRWYVWAAVGGAVAIVGSSVAIYYGTRVDETPMGFIKVPPAASKSTP
jgi:hypothetical protein